MLTSQDKEQDHVLSSTPRDDEDTNRITSPLMEEYFKSLATTRHVTTLDGSMLNKI